MRIVLEKDFVVRETDYRIIHAPSKKRVCGRHPFIAAQLCASEEFHSALVAPKLLPLLWEGLNENSVLVGYFEQVRGLEDIFLDRK